MAWATASTFTPVLSPHLAIYDSTLVVVGAMLTVDVVLRHETELEHITRRWLFPLLATIYLTAWISQPLAGLRSQSS